MRRTGSGRGVIRLAGLLSSYGGRLPVAFHRQSSIVSHWPFSVPCPALDEGQLYLQESCGWRDLATTFSGFVISLVTHFAVGTQIA
jgi:hypothetical protein